MRYIGTFHTPTEAGAALIAGQFCGLFTGDSNADATMRDILIDDAEAAKAGDTERSEELAHEALYEVSRRIVLITEDGETISVDKLTRYLSGSIEFEMWSTAPNSRPLMADFIPTPKEGWRAIDSRIKGAALDWVDAIHEQDGVLKLAVLLQELEAGR